MSKSRELAVGALAFAGADRNGLPAVGQRTTVDYASAEIDGERQAGAGCARRGAVAAASDCRQLHSCGGGGAAAPRPG